MNRLLSGLPGALLGVLLIGSCKEDPTTPGVGTVGTVTMEFDARTIAVAESVRTFAVVRDQTGQPLTVAASVAAGCTGGIVSVLPASDAPTPRTAFFIKALAFGSACVVATVQGLSDTTQVTTVPASLVLTSGPDTLPSGTIGNYVAEFRDAKNAAMAGVPVPAYSVSDTTIAKPGATAGQVQGRRPGVTTLTVSGAGLSTTKTIAVVAVNFTGTTSTPVDPGAILTIRRDPAGPVFDANTTTSVGTVIAATRSADTIQVRISDVASAGAKTFSLAGVGPDDVAYANGSYTVNTPAAFTGTFNPTTAQAGISIAVIRNPADPPFSSTTVFSRGTSAANLAAVTPVAGSVTADSVKLAISDLAAGATYLVQVTRLGPTNLALRGSYTLPVGTFTGTVSPNSGTPSTSIVLRRGGADPLFDADTRAYLNGIRAFIESFSADTAVVIVPPLETSDPADLRLSRMGAGQSAVDGGAVVSTSALPIDPNDHGDDTPNTPVAVGNGNTFFTMSGSCDAGAVTKGSDDCDDYFKITNTSAVDVDVTVVASWFTDADVDILICDGAALSNPFPNNVPSCGYAVGFDDLVNADAATGANPETTTFTVPANSTYIIWMNFFDHGTPNSTLVRMNVSGLP